MTDIAIKFRRKSPIVEAVLWDGTDKTLQEISEWAKSEVRINPKNKMITIFTDTDILVVSIGDWIVKDSKGFRPYMGSNFREEYEIYRE